MRAVQVDTQQDSDAPDELPAMQPIPHEEDWKEPRPRRGRTWLVVSLLAIVTALVVFGVWSQSYFLTAHDDGYVGIDRGFPFAGLSTEYVTSEVPVDDLDSADRERLVDSHRILSRDDAEQVLDELPRRFDQTVAPEAGDA